ncbi:unnamed protein product, partial [Didymodactylos carnosus]
SEVTQAQWANTLKDKPNSQYVVQQYYEPLKFMSMNIVGMFFCFNQQCFNMGIIRMSNESVVNISDGGYYIRPFVRRHVYRDPCGGILTKSALHEQILSRNGDDDRWKHMYLSSSGGSGGKRLFFATDIKENQFQRKILVQGMIEHKVFNEADICLNLFEANNMYRSCEIFNDFCAIANVTTLPMGFKSCDSDVLKIIRMFKPNVCMSSPYRLMQLTLFANKMGESIKFDKIIFSCEPLQESNREYFRHALQCDCFMGMYGSAELGVFAFQSPALSATSSYIYPKSLVHIEIVADDNNSKQYGRIIATNLVRRQNQLIRFDTGDIGQLVSVDSDKYGILNVKSSQRLLLVGSGSLSKSDIDQCMMEECHSCIEWQLLIDQVDEKASVTFRYVIRQGETSENIVSNIKNYLEKCFNSSNYNEEIYLNFECIQLTDLIRSTVSNKVLKIIDRRIY